MDPSVVSIDTILNQLESHDELIENQQKQIEALQQEVKELKSKKTR
jgi:cell division protein FtsL